MELRGKLTDIEQLIDLSIGGGSCIPDSLLPGYGDDISFYKEQAKARGRSDGEFLDDDFFRAFPETKDTKIFIMGENKTLDLEEYQGKAIVYDIIGKHFAAIQISGDKVYLMDSLLGHAEWSLNPKYDVHSIPVPPQGTNDCAINTLVNLKNSDRIIDIYNSSQATKEEVRELTSIRRFIKTCEEIKKLLSSNPEIDILHKMMKSITDNLQLDSSISSLIMKDLSKGLSFKKCIVELDNIITVSEEKREIIISGIEKRKHSVTLTAEQTLTSTLSSDSGFGNDDSESHEVSQPAKSEQLSTPKNEIEKFEEIRKQYIRETSEHQEQKVFSKEPEVLSDSKDLKEELNQSYDEEFINYILPNISCDEEFINDFLPNKLAAELKSSHTEKEKARKMAINEAEVMLGMTI